MADLLLKAINYAESLKSIYLSCKSTIIPIIKDYRFGVIKKWNYLKMMVK